MKILKKKWVLVTLSILVTLVVIVAFYLSSIGAAMILYPMRKKGEYPMPAVCEEVTMQGAGVALHGWRCKAVGQRRGTLIYLHGVSDHAVSGAGVMERFRNRGFDVIAYDSRAHGKSGGDACTYGFYEKDDLRKVVDQIDARQPIVVMGTSLGAAVALQTAAVDERISAVIAAECFSDLRTVVNERAPFVFGKETIESAIAIAEKKGAFDIDAVSPVIAAEKINVPVFLIHGAMDAETSPEHSKRINDAVAKNKRLLLVPGANHNQSLQSHVWVEIEEWLEEVLTRI